MLDEKEVDVNSEDYEVQPIKLQKNLKRKVVEEKELHKTDQDINEYIIQYELQNKEKYKKLQQLLDEPVTFTAETSKCKYCQKYTLITMEKQARSADEKQDVFATCSNEECHQKRTQKLS